MSSTERYGIYYAPDPGSEFWQLASEWLGRDAATGERVPQNVPECIDDAPFEAATEAARRYGFHATLKAPMHLAEGRGEENLMAAAEAFAQTQAPARIGNFVVRALHGFLAIVPHVQNRAVSDLAAHCVRHFEPLRAPMSAEQRARRLSADLNARQAELLEQYGYPYVMDEFRMHLTLTCRLPAAELDKYMTAATARFAGVLFDTWMLDRIAVYREKEPGAGFVRLADFELAG